jgi:hypothetical protein
MPFETHVQQLFFQLNACFHCPYVTSSLTRGWICRLQLMLPLASAVVIRSESRGTRDHIILSQIRDSPTWRARSPYLYTPRTGLPRYTPRHRVPFSSPPTTRRVTVEVFDHASTRESDELQSQVTFSLGAEPHLGLMTRYLLQFDRHGLVFVKVKVMLRPTVSRPVRLGIKHPSGA